MIDELKRERRVVDCYIEMGRLSTEMVAAAQRADWDAVIAGEKACAELVAQLKTMGDLTPLNAALRDEKRGLIRNILRNDAAIRDLAEPRLRELELKLRGPKIARKVALAYGASLRPY
jgi:flagellar protein FliT